MIEYMRCAISREKGRFAFNASIYLKGAYLVYFGESLSLLECFALILLFVARQKRAGRLTPLNLGYLMLAVEGFSHGQIAEKMGVSRSDIAYHAQQVRKVLGAETEAQAVFLSTILGYLRPAYEGETGWQ